MKVPQAVLALGLEEHAARILLMESGPGGRAVSAAASFTLTLNLFKDAPDLAGLELRQHLDRLHVNTRACILCIPAHWLLYAEIALPDMPESDIASYLDLQAERQFPLAGNEIVHAASRFESPAGGRRAMLLALPLSRLRKLQAAARAARLEIVGVTASVVGLARWSRAPASAVLFATREHIDLAITDEGSLVTLRTFGWLEALAEADTPAPDGLTRELRITLKHLPKSLRAGIDVLEVYSHGVDITRVQDAAYEGLGGTTIALEARYLDITLSANAPPDALDPSLAAAADLYLRGEGVRPNFLPPAPGRFELLLRKALKRRTATIAAIAAAAVLIAGTTLGVQAHVLNGLEAERAAIAPVADEAATLQERIRAYRAWFDAGAPTLEIASGLASAFPEDGAVWLKSASIKDGASISCAGKATSNRAWLDMLESLRSTPGFGSVQVAQVRGDAPLEFSLACTWLKGAP